jgi:hypothetical protein
MSNATEIIELESTGVAIGEFAITRGGSLSCFSLWLEAEVVLQVGKWMSLPLLVLLMKLPAKKCE